MTDQVETRRYQIQGRVQGVGFRYFTMRKALALDLVGWVRNRPDGSVEAVAQGRPDALDDFEHRLRQGPAWSKVTVLNWRVEDDDHQRYNDFSINPTG